MNSLPSFFTSALNETAEKCDMRCEAGWLRTASTPPLDDEASGIPDIVFEVGMGALSTPGAKVVMAGNPTRTSGFFYDTHHSLRHRWRTMHVNCLDVPRAQGHIEDIKGQIWRGQQRLSRACTG